MIGPKMLREMEEQMVMIHARLKEAVNRQKSYADRKRTFR